MDLARSLAYLPEGGQVVIAARRAGLDIEQLSGISVSGDMPREDYPVLFFGDWHSGQGCVVVSPRGVDEWRRD